MDGGFTGNLHRLFWGSDTFIEIKGLRPLTVDIDSQRLDGFFDFFWQGDGDACRQECPRCDHCGHYADQAVSYDRDLAARYIAFLDTFNHRWLHYDLELKEMAEKLTAAGTPERRE